MLINNVIIARPYFLRKSFYQFIRLWVVVGLLVINISKSFAQCDNVTVYNLTGPSSYCDPSGFTLTLSGSQSGIEYQLVKGGINAGIPVPGTNGVITWPNQTAGSNTTFSVYAFDVSTGCNVNMNGTVVVTAYQQPSLYDLSAASTSYCSNTSGVTLSLNGSNNANFQYQLYKDGVADGSPVMGTGGIISWNNKTSGTYTVVAQNTLCSGCTRLMNGSVQITQEISPALFTVSGTSSYCEGSPGASVFLSGSENGTDYQLMKDGVPDGASIHSTGTSAITWPNKTAGTYTVVASVGSCTRSMTGSAVLTKISSPVIYHFSGPSAYCAGGTGVTLTLEGSQTGINYTLYRGTTAVGSLTGTGSSVSWNNIAVDGTYTVTAKTSSTPSCSVNMTGSVVLTSTALPAPGAGADVTSICQGNSANLFASGGLTYSWAPATGLNSTNIQNPKATPISSTLYTVTVTDVNGCSATGQVMITVHARPTPAITPNSATICNGGSATFTASGGTSYAWSSGVATANTTVYPTTATTYYVTVTDANSCSSTTSVTVAVNPVPVVSFNGLPSNSCNNGSQVTLTGSPVPLSFSAGIFSGTNVTNPALGIARFSPSGLVAGNYNITYTYTDPSTSCSASATQVITVNPAPPIHAISGGGSYCQGGSGVPITVSNPDNLVTYELFLNGATTGLTQTKVGLPFTGIKQSGTYIIVGTMGSTPATSCSATMTGSVPVTVNPYPDDAQMITGSNVVCAGTDVVYSIPLINNADSYVWQLPANVTITQGAGTDSIKVFYGTGAVSGTISVKGNNSCGDGAGSGLPVTVKPLPSAAGVITSAKTKVCQGETNVNYEVGAITGATSYTWTVPSGATITSGQGTSKINVNFGNSAVSGNVTVAGTNSCGTGTASSVSVTVGVAPQLTLNKTPLKVNCSGNPIQLAASSTTVTVPAVSFSWQALNGGNIVGSTTTNTPYVSAPGIYVVTVTEPVNSCTTTDQVTVLADTVKPKNVTILTGGTLSCSNPQITLSASASGIGSLSYSWSASNGGEFFPVINQNPNTSVPYVDKPGTYTVTVTDLSNSCTAIQNIALTASSTPPAVTIDPPVAITCSQKTVTLYAHTSPGVSFSWSGPGSIVNGNSPNPIVNSPGVFTLVVTATNGCTNSAIVQVNKDLTLPIVSVNQNVGSLNCTNSQVMIYGQNGTPGATLYWTGGSITGSTYETQYVSIPGKYKLTATHPITGCTASDSVTIVTDYTLPDAQIDQNPDTLTCLANTTTLNGISGTLSATFSWTGPSGASFNNTTIPTPTVDKKGIYTLMVTGPNGCKNSASVTVSQDTVSPARPVITAETLSCVKTTALLSVYSAAVTYLWSGPPSSNIINGNTNLATVDVPGIYTVLLTNPMNGCTKQNSVNVIKDNSIPVAKVVGGPYEINCTVTSLIIDGSQSVGVNPVWTASQGGRIVSGGNTFKPTVDASGTYTLTVTHSVSGCTQSVDVPVAKGSDMPGTSIDVNPPELTCSVKTVTLSGKATESGTSVQWTANPGNIVSGDQTYSPVVDKAGTYVLTVTRTSDKCKNTAAIYVQSDIASPSLVVSVPAKFTCSRDTVQLTASSPSTNVSYSWSATSPAKIKLGDENVPKPDVLSPGDYTVTLTDLGNQCTSVNTVNVGVNKTVPDLILTKTPVPTITCSTQQVSLYGGSLTSGATFLWSTSGTGSITGINSQNPQVNAKGYYRFRVKDPSNGCTKTDSVQVVEDLNKPLVGVDNAPLPITCVNTKTKVKGSSSTPNVTFSWSGPGNISDPTIGEPTVDAPGVYTFRVTSVANGCFDFKTVTVNRDTVKPAAPLVADGKVCFGAPAAALNATGDNIKWYSTSSPSPSTKIFDGSTFVPSSWTVAGTYQVFVTQTNPANGCESKAKQVNYTVNALPALPATTSKAICEGLANPALQATGTNVKWYDAVSGGNLLSGPGYTNTFVPPASVSAPGTYTYFATQTNFVTGCESQAQGVLLTINPNPAKPVVNNLNPSVCQGTPNPLFIASGNSVKWYTNTTFTSPTPGNSYSSTATTAGSYNYYVTQTSAQGCVSLYETVNLTIMTNPQVFSLTGGGAYCASGGGVPIGLNGSELNTNYSLLLNSSTVMNSVTGTGNAFDFGSQTSAGNYTAIAIGNNGCQSGMSGSKSVVVNPLPSAIGTINGQMIICQGSTGMTYSVSPVSNVDSYQWTVPSGATISSGQGSNTIVVNFGASAIGGPITVTGRNTCGLGATTIATVTVVASPTLTANANGGTVTCANPILTLHSLSSTTGATYSWNAINGGHFAPGADPSKSDVQVDAAGDYVITVKETLNSCATKATVSVLSDKAAPQNALVSSSNSGFLSCTFPQATLSATTTDSYSKTYAWTASGGGNILGSDLIATPVVNKAGTYMVTITNSSNGCYSTASLNIAEDTIRPVISINKNPLPLNCNNKKVQLFGSAPGATLLWTDLVGGTYTGGANSSSPLVDKPGKYTLTATGTNGCLATNFTTVASNDSVPLNVNISTPGTLTCSVTSLQLSGSSTTSSASFSWSALNGGHIYSGANGTLVTIDAPGDYKLVVTHPRSFCKDSTTVTVLPKNITAPVITISVSPDPVTCKNGTSVINTTVTPAGSVLNWTGPGTISDPAIASPTVSAPGNYTLRAVNPATGCITVQTINVPDNHSPADASITVPDTISCIKPQVSIYASTTLTDFKAAWATTDGHISGSNSNLNVAVTQKGTYTLTLTNNASGCSISKSIKVIDNIASPDFRTDNPPAITCSNPKVTLNGYSSTPGVTFLWTGPAGANISTPNSSSTLVDAAVKYTLVITGSNGCAATGDVTVTANKTAPGQPGIDPPQQLTCSLSSVQLKVSSTYTDVDYLWTTTGTGHISNGNSAVATVDDIGTYTVKVTDRTNGCFSQNSVTVTKNNSLPLPVIDPGPYVISCSTPAPVLKGSNTSTGINPVWSATLGGHIVSGGNTFTPAVDAAGTYTLTTTDATSGCPRSASVTVTAAIDLPKFKVNMFPDTLTCSVSKSTVTLYGEPDDPSDQITWTANPGFIVSGETSFTPVVNKEGNYLFTVTRPSTGCKNMAVIVVKENKTNPVLSLLQPLSKITCTVSEIQLNASSSSKKVSYAWSTSGTGAIKLGFENVQNPVVTAQGTYNVTLTDLSNSCTSSGSIKVDQDVVIPSVNVDNTPAKLNCSNKVVGLSVSSNTSGVTYLWSGPASALITNPTSYNPQVNAKGTYMVTVTNPVNGCPASGTVFVDQDIAVPFISPFSTPDTLKCTVSSVKITGNSSTPNVLYTWDGPGITSSNVSSKEPYVSLPGMYSLTVTSQDNGCTSTGSVNVVENKNKPAIPLVADQYVCDKAPAGTLTSSGTNVRWYSDISLSSLYKVHDGLTFVPSTSTAVGDYKFYVTQTDSKSLCESDPAVVTYSVKKLPSSPVNTDKSICQGDNNPALQASGNNVKWYDAGGIPIGSGNSFVPPLSVSAPGTYSYFATQTDVFGCESATQKVSLTINTVPVKPVVDKLTAGICMGSANPSFTASGNAIKWYDPSSALVGTSNVFTPGVSATGNYSYHVTQTSVQGCTSPYETVTFIINPLPGVFNVTGGGTYCANQSGKIMGLDGSESGVNYQLMWNGTNVVATVAGTGSAFDFGIQKSAGTYTVLATSPGGCQRTMNDNAIVAVTSLPDAAGTITGPSIVCQGVQGQKYTVPSIANAISYTWTVPPGATITSGQGTNTIFVGYSSATSGQVSVVGTNNCGQGAISKLSINVVVPPQISLSSTWNTITCDNPTIAITASVSASSSVSYTWNATNGGNIVSGETSAILTVNAKGNYTAIVTDNNSCTSQSSVVINDDLQAPQNLQISPTGSDIITCTKTQVILTASSTTSPVSYSWVTYGGQISSSSGNTNPGVTVEKAGIYEVTVKNMNNGCIAKKSYTVTEQKILPDAPVFNPLPANLSCIKSSVTLSGNSDTPGVTYVWSGPGLISNGTTPNPTVFKDGTYTLTVKAPNGCVTTGTVAVIIDTVHPSVWADTNPLPLTCKSSTVSLSGSSTTTGANLVWTGPGSFTSVLANPSVSVTGTYTLTVTNSINGCISYKQVIVSDDKTAPSVIFPEIPATITCSSPHSTVKATQVANASYLWTTADGNIYSGANTFNADVTKPGTYTLQITDQNNGCTGSASIDVSADQSSPDAAIIPADPITCTHPAITLTGSSSNVPVVPVMVNWTTTNGTFSGSTSTFTPAVTKDGMYVMTVTNTTTGCIGTASVTVVRNDSKPNIKIDKNPDVITCGMPAIRLNGTASGATLLWTGPSVDADPTSSAPTVSKAGRYYLVATGTNGCIARDSVDVTSNLVKPVGVSINVPDVLTCIHPTLSLTGNSNTDHAMFDWSVISGGNIASAPGNSVVVVNGPGKYRLVVTDPVNSCRDTATVVVNQDISVPVISFPQTPSTITCASTSSSLSASVSPANSGLLWTGPGTISNPAITNPNVNAPGTYVLTATHPASGCKSTGTQVVAFNKTAPVIILTPPAALTCSNPSGIIHGTTSAYPQKTDYILKWTTTNGAISGPDNLFDLNVTQKGLYTLSVTDNTNGCSATKDVQVDADQNIPDVTVDPNPDKLTCAVLKVSLLGSSGTPGATLLWTGPGNISDIHSTKPDVDKAGVYVLTVTALNGCTSQGTVTVTTNKTDPGVPNIKTPDALTCSKTSVDLEVSPQLTNVDYVWSTTGSGTITNGHSAIASVNAIGTYTVVVTDRTSKCTNQSSVTVTESKPLPVVSIAGGTNVLTCSLKQITLTGTSTDSNPVWTATQGGHIVSGANSLAATVDAAGTYTLTVTSATSGCTNSASVAVTSSSDVPQIYVNPFPLVLTCSVDSVMLEGRPLDSGNSFSWAASPGHISSHGTSVNPYVDKAGTYILTVVNPLTSCQATASIEVKENRTPPQVIVANPVSFTCVVKEVQLSALCSNSNVSFLWSTTGTGSIKIGYTNVPNPFVLTPATYTVTALDPANQCTTVKNITVGEDKNLPDIHIDKNQVQLTCKTKLVVLSGSSQTKDASYNWSTLGAGNIFNSTSASPSVDAIGYYRLTVTNPANGCPAMDSVEVTLNTVAPDIWVNDRPDTLTCAVKSVKLSGSSSVSVSYLWSGPIIFADATVKEPSVDKPGTYYLTVTSTANGCINSKPVQVVENTTVPVAPVIPVGSTCLGRPATALTAVGSNIRWYKDPADIASGSSVFSGNSFTPSSVSTVGQTTYYATQTDSRNQCESNYTAVTYSVLALPNPPVNVDNSVCQGLPNPSLQATGTQIKWYDSPGGTLIGSGSTFIPSVSAPGTYTYFATQTDASACESLTKGVSLTIRPNPSRPLVDKLTAEICAGDVNSTFVASGNDIKWYANSSLLAPVKTGGNFTSPETAAGTYSYYLTQTSTYGCVSPYETVNFTIKALPQKFVTSGGGIYCENQNGLSVALNGSESTAAYQLVLNGSNVITSLNGTGSALDFGLQKAPGNYTITATGVNGCSVPMNGGVSVISTPLPGAAGAISGPIGICQGTTSQQYTIAPVANANSYVWSVPSGATISAGLNSSTIFVDYTSAATSGPVSVYAMNACGAGPVSSDLQIMVTQLPANAMVIRSVSNNICLGDSGIIYEVDPIANTTDYEWSLPAGATIQKGAHTRQIKVKFAPNSAMGNQTIKVRGRNTCGMGDWSAPFPVSVNPIPAVNAGMDQNICTSSTTLQGNGVPAGGTGKWDLIYGYGVLDNSALNTSSITSIAQGNNILTWTVTLNGCKAVDTVRVINNTVYVDAGPDISICTSDVSLKGSAVPAGTTGLWSVASGSASFVTASQPSTLARNFGYGDTKLYWTVTNKGCNNKDSVTITNYQPTKPDAGGDQTICTNRTVLTANQPVYGTGQWSVSSGSATFADNKLPNTAITGVGKDKNILVWTITNYICSASDTVIISNNAADVNAGYDQLLCDNRTTLNASLPADGATGQWSVLLGSASFMDSKSNVSKISGLVNGTNRLIWSILRGSCVNTDTVDLVCHMPSTADAGPDQFISGNSATLSANLPSIGTGKWSVISGAGTFDNSSANNAQVSGLNPGGNILRWTITYMGCTSYDEVTVTNGTVEQVDAGQDQVICASETQLEASKPQYGFGVWTVQKGAASFDDNELYNTKVTNLSPGTNVLRWSVVVSGIEFYDTVRITNNQPTGAVVGPSQALCGDSSMLTGNIPFQGTGKWSLEGGSGTIDNLTQYNSKITKLNTGDNLFRWTITKGTCESSALLKITNNKPTPAYAGLDQSICDDSTSLQPNTPFIGTGEWSVVGGSGRFSGNNVLGLATGLNTLRWTIRKSTCTSYDDVNVISYKPTPASAGFNTVVCVDSLFLTANKPNTALGEFGRWSILNGSGIFSDTTSNTSLIKRLASGKNVLRWTINSHGCISSKEVEVNFAYLKSVAGSDVTTCDNHVLLNANNAGIGQGEWSVIGGSGTAIFASPSSPNTEVQNLDKGKNILRWTIRNLSCISTSDVTITNDSPTDAFAGGDQSLCMNYTYLEAKAPLIGKGMWSVLSGSGSFDDTTACNALVTNVGLGSNTYRWTVTNKNCVSTDEVYISNDKPVNVNAGLNQTLCTDSASLSAYMPVVGTGAWSVTRGGGLFKDALSRTSRIYKLAPDTNVLRWTVTNKQCIDYSEIKIVNNSPTVASAGADVTVCSDQITLDGNNPVFGTGEWGIISGSGVFIKKNLYDTDVSSMTRGKNVFRWKISKQSCSSYDDVTVVDDLPTQPIAGTDIAVCDNNAPLNANKPLIGKGYWSILSGKGTFVDSSKYNTIIVGLGQGSNILRWTTTNNRCSLSDMVEVRNNQTDVYAGPDQMVFEDHSMLVGNEPTRGIGTWSLDAGSGSILSRNNFESDVVGLSEGANTFIWSVDIDGCISSDRVIVSYYKLPTASYSVNQTEGCPPLQVNFTKTTVENYPFSWDFGINDSTSNEENPSFTYTKPGVYTAKLTVTGPDGNKVSKLKTINVYDLPVVNFEVVPKEIYIPEQELRCYNYTDKGAIYQWNFGDGKTSEENNPAHVYTDSGTYTITLKVWSAHQCVDSMVLTNGIRVFEKSRIRFPNAFTPNPNGSSDGKYNRTDFSNDVFYPIVIMGGLREYRMEIFNRWGILLFSSNDIDTGWDGYYKGKLLMQDVYIYRVSGIYNDGKRFSVTGDVLLMRK